MQVTLFDRAAYNISKREYTDEGFLRVPGRVARTGIQDYLASELGLDGDPMRIVKVYRPEEEVFKDESLASYNISDVTNDHPPKMVDAQTFKAVAVGVVAGPGTRDGDYVIAPLVVKDAGAIKNIESGKVQLSAGYTAEYDNSPGTVDGQEYEFIQRNIKINHVALVDRARAGAMARVFDKQLEKTMAKVTLDNGRSVELEDAVAAQVEDSIDRLKTLASTEKESADDAKAASEALQAQVDSLQEELKEAKDASSDKAIMARVVAAGKAMDDARKIAGKDFTCDSANDTDIKRAALIAANPDKGYDSKADAYIQAAFDLEMEKEEEDEDEEEKKKKAADAARAQLAKDMATKDKDKPNAKQSYIDNLNNGWKKSDGGDK